GRWAEKTSTGQDSSRQIIVVSSLSPYLSWSVATPPGRNDTGIFLKRRNETAFYKKYDKSQEDNFIDL
ncbi:MAG: hypothetical protein ACYCS8_05725, partial [Acidithiobacillus sp.]